MALQPLSSISQIVTYNSDVDLKDKTGSPKMQGTTVTELFQNPGTGKSSIIENIAIGIGSMQAKAGAGSIAIGGQSLNASTGVANVCVGEETLQYAPDASYSVAFGASAGRRANGTGNVFVGGYNAYYEELTGGYNTIIGSQAGIELEGTSKRNVALGAAALWQLTVGDHNTAVGQGALYTQTTGDDNTAIGHGSGNGVVTGFQNTLLGRSTGNGIRTGSLNTIIGYGANVSGAATINENVFGSSATGGGNNTVVLGNSSITALKCQVQTITGLSDRRDKTNIKDSVYGLDLINKLKPVTFDWNMRDGAKVGIKDLGFIAQDLKEVDDDYTQMVDDSNPDKILASYGRLVPVLVKAIQELTKEIELLKLNK